MKSKVLVLGCGEMGEMAIDDLVTYGSFDEVVIGTRHPEKAKPVMARLRGKRTKLSVQQVDVHDHDKLVALMRGVEVVLNSAGPNYKNALPVARAALQAQVDLVDMSDDYASTAELLALDTRAKEAGVTFVIGLGASPGINNVIARLGANALDEVEEIHTAWIMSGADPGGLALSYHLLYSLSGKALTFQDGKFVEVQSFRDGREVLEFPKPVGNMEVFHIGHPEPVTLPRYFKNLKYADDKASFNPPFVNDWIVNLRELGLCAEEPATINGVTYIPMDIAAAALHKTCKNLQDYRKEGALRVEVKGKWRGKTTRLIYAASGRIAEGTGIAAAIGAQMLADRLVEEKGAFAPEGCIDPGIFMQELLDKRSIGELITKRIEE